MEFDSVNLVHLITGVLSSRKEIEWIISEIRNCNTVSYQLAKLALSLINDLIQLEEPPTDTAVLM